MLSTSNEISDLSFPVKAAPKSVEKSNAVGVKVGDEFTRKDFREVGVSEGLSGLSILKHLRRDVSEFALKSEE